MQKGNKTPINKIGTPDWAKNGWRQFNPVSSISSIANRPTLTVSNGK